MKKEREFLSKNLGSKESNVSLKILEIISSIRSNWKSSITNSFFEEGMKKEREKESFAMNIRVFIRRRDGYGYGMEI